MRSVFIVAVSVLAVNTAHTQPAQVLRGRVVGDSLKPVAGAVVSVTMAPERTFKQDTTRADGRWEVRFDHPSGDYLVHIAALGRQAFRKRVTSAPSDSVVTVDATLAAVVQQLATVQVRASRPKPGREGDGRLPDGISNEQTTLGVEGMVTADLAGDLAAIAGTIPGLSLVTNGVSAFGLDPSQNAVTLNGMSFPGSAIPRNARASTRFITSAYDPARGGFAGVETAVTLQQGSASTSRRANLTVDAPFLQATDPIGARLGSRVTGGVASMGGSGEWVEDKWYYNLALDVSRRVSDAPSLLTGDAALFGITGVASDSVVRLLQTLNGIGIPAVGSRAALQRATNDATFAMRIDHAPYKPQSFEESPSTWAVVALGRVQQRDALNVGLTSTPARGAQSALLNGAVQLLYSTYVQDYKLSETKTGLTLSHSRGTPYLRLPEGTLLLSSRLPDGSTGTSSLAFGGNARNDTEDTQWGWETISNFQWFVQAAHKLKVTAQSKFEGYDQRVGSNTMGAFSFASLTELAANRPSSFSRTLTQLDRTGTAWSGFASIGDAWKYSPMLDVVYGARLELNHYLTRPVFNPLVESAFGARTDAAPSRVHVSPRVGFSWRYSGGPGYNGMSFSNLGSRLIGPTGMVRGGIGEFRAALSPQLLAGPSVLTGLADAEQRIACVGAAVPTPNWQNYLADENTIPNACVNVPNAPVLADIAPSVQLVDPSFDAPRSWRGNLAWVAVVRKLSFTVDAALSLNLNQASSVDLNFTGTPRFTLSDEGRPVFSSVSAIVPANGALSAVESRRSSGFATVMSRRSDLRSASRQVTISLTPLSLNMTSIWLSGAYTIASTRGDVRGYDGGAFGDPRLIEQGRTDFDIRHRLQLQLGKSLPMSSSITMFINAQSGIPYTPLVNGDVNGDGRSLDRAFVFDPARASDPAFGAAMNSLLANAPAKARACLLTQLGRAAGRNSCEGPWAVTATARMGLITNNSFLGRRVNVALSITNPLGGLDQILHGDELHGWGMNVPPDPILMTVRGFDPATNRFRYEVNPRFGATSPAQTTMRMPFRVTLDGSFNLGPPPGRQQLERVLNRGRAGHAGQRLSADSIRTRFSRNVPNLYSQLIRLSDSLLLSREQLMKLREGEVRFTVRADSIWMPLARELAAMPEEYDAGLATDKTEAATDAAWEMARDESLKIKEILSPIQFALSPGVIQYLPNAKGKILIRMYSY